MESTPGIVGQQAHKKIPEWQERELGRRLDSIAIRIDRLEQRHQVFDQSERRIVDVTIGAVGEGFHRIKSGLGGFFRTLVMGAPSETPKS